MSTMEFNRRLIAKHGYVSPLLPIRMISQRLLYPVRRDPSIQCSVAHTWGISAPSKIVFAKAVYSVTASLPLQRMLMRVNAISRKQAF